LKSISKLFLIGVAVVVAVALIGGLGLFSRRSQKVDESLERPAKSPEATFIREARPGFRRLDFSQLDDDYRFAADVPSTWQGEHVRPAAAVNIYDPSAEGNDNLEKSQIFIRNFEAAKFLTLTTVDVLSRQDSQVKGHGALKYVIEKKPGVPDFPNQPSWRNKRHEVIDVRLTNNNPSLFYVVARNPQLVGKKFEDFVDSLVFHNDPESLVPPLERALERITQKSFGLKVAPDSSPIEGERFSGYHTGLDFETFEEERNREVLVFAICGGPLRQKSLAAGYGGVVVQECLLRDQPIIVVYGHLKLASVVASVGDYLAPSELIGVLGKGSSEETDGERKHLHLGILKGMKIDVAGYVGAVAELSHWLDPALLLFPNRF